MAKPKTQKKQNNEVTIHYLKTASYRTYHVDGVYGGITPKGGLYCELFIDRNVTPQTVTHEVTEEGHLGTEKQRSGKKGLIREIECGLVLDINTAIALKNWLEGKIKEHDRLFIKKGKDE